MLRRYSMLVFVFVSLLALPAFSQPAAEPPPALADLLARVPFESASDDTQAALLALSEPDIRALCNLLRPPGAGGDAGPRFILHGLVLAAAHAESEAPRQTVGRALVRALWAEPACADRGLLIEQLELLGDARTVGGLVRALDDPQLCTPAARALGVLGGDEAVAGLRAALPRVPAASQAAILNALIVLRAGLVDARSAAYLSDVGGTPQEQHAREHYTEINVRPYLDSPDPAVRRLALHAAAQTGALNFRRRLSDAAAAPDPDDRAAGESALLEFAARQVELQRPEIAGELYQALLSSTPLQRPQLRCAALTGLAALGDAAIPDLLAALADEDVTVRTASADALARLRGTVATRACIDALGRAAAPQKAALLDALARRGEALALAPAIRALEDADETVRVAAIATVAQLGGEAAVEPLLPLLGAPRGVADAARHALIKLPGPGPTTRLTGALESAAPESRVAILGLLAERPAGDLEPIYARITDTSPAVRRAALRALGALAGDDALPRLLNSLAAASTDEDRSAAGDALAAIAGRSPQRERAAAMLIDALPTATIPVRAALLTAVGQIGGDAALAAVRAALSSPEPEIREAAVRALGVWPDDRPADDALRLAHELGDTKLGVLALRAYVRMIGRNERRAPPDTLRMCAAALDAARRPDERRLVLAELGKVMDPGAVELLVPHLKDELRAEAAAALLGVVDGLIPQHWTAARTALESVLAAEPSADQRTRAEELRRRVARFEDHITDWWVAGPYRKAGVEGVDLVGVAFEPEQPGSKVDWRPQPASEGPDGSWRVDLHATMAGDNAAGYLLTRARSPRTQRVRLELGSDDGVEAWVNGTRIHQNKVCRGCEPGQDLVEVELRAGENTLLLKVLNGGGAWAACARFRTLEGGRVEGLHVERGPRP